MSKQNGYNPRIVSAYWKSCKIPPATPEYRFDLGRRWRFDFAWPDQKLALEVDGGIWIHGGHNRGAQIKKTWEKENRAHELGWRILKCEPADLCVRETTEMIRRALNYENQTNQSMAISTC